jgi:hypothetical protein
MGKEMGMGAGGIGFVIDGQLFDPDRIDTRVRLGSTEDWLIVNDDVMDQTFHLPINPFQMVSRNGRPEAQRRWKDTVLVRSGEEVRLRVSFRDFPGRTVYHCPQPRPRGSGAVGGAADAPVAEQKANGELHAAASALKAWNNFGSIFWRGAHRPEPPHPRHPVDRPLPFCPCRPGDDGPAR